MSNFGYALPATGSDAELLALTRDAIARITVNGQMYTSEGKQLTRANLPALWDQVRVLEARIAADSSGPAENVVRFKRD